MKVEAHSDRADNDIKAIETHRPVLGGHKGRRGSQVSAEDLKAGEAPRYLLRT